MLQPTMLTLYSVLLRKYSSTYCMVLEYLLGSTGVLVWKYWSTPYEGLRNSMYLKNRFNKKISISLQKEMACNSRAARHLSLICSMSVCQTYFTSSKTTLTDYQCVSTGCCTHVAKTETTIDNQHVTKSLKRYEFLPK